MPLRLVFHMLNLLPRLFEITLAALGYTMAISNNVPIIKSVPGYQLGTKGSDVEVRVFYDLLCPDSKDAHDVWKELLPQASPIEGQSYEEFLSLKVTPFVLPYHLYSFQLTQVVPYLQDLCAQDPKNCPYVDQYVEYCLDNLSDIVGKSDISEQDFEAQWATTI